MQSIGVVWTGLIKPIYRNANIRSGGYSVDGTPGAISMKRSYKLHSLGHRNKTSLRYVLFLQSLFVYLSGSREIVLMVTNVLLLQVFAKYEVPRDTAQTPYSLRSVRHSSAVRFPTEVQKCTSCSSENNKILRKKLA